MDDFTKKHLNNWIKSRFLRNEEEIFNLFVRCFNQLDDADKEYVLNNSWEVLEREVENKEGKEFERLKFYD